MILVGLRPERKVALVKRLLNERMKSHWFRRLFVNPEKVDDFVVMGTPEGTIATIVETYMVMESGASDAEIFAWIENFRQPKGQMPQNIDVIRYILYRVRLEHGSGGGITDNEIVRAITISGEFVKEFGDWVEEGKQESASAPDMAFMASLPHPEQNRPIRRYPLRKLLVEYYEHPKTIGEVVMGIPPFHSYSQVAVLLQENEPIAMIAVEQGFEGTPMICMTRPDGSHTNFGAYAPEGQQGFFEAVERISAQFG